MLCSSCGEPIEAGKEITHSDVYFNEFGATAASNSIICKDCWDNKQEWKSRGIWFIIIFMVFFLLVCFFIWIKERGR